MHRFLTSDIPGTGGTIKETPEDFQVWEVPIYSPCGEGEHTFTEIKKQGITTLEAIRRISRALNIPDKDMGYAGMKDARGITRQTLSIPRTPPDLILSLELPGIKILSAVRHRSKLKLGHLAGNRFIIRVRGTYDGARKTAGDVLDILSARGVPNYFGPQRYGVQGNSHEIGRALIRSEFREAIDALIGDPARVMDERWKAAITAYRKNDIRDALSLFPHNCRTERDILQRLLQRPEAWDKAFHAVPPRLKTLYISAYQSHLFDQLLDQRLDEFDKVMNGDLAWKHNNGACFLVEDATVEADRAKIFEISPTGPLFGCKMKFPAGQPLEMEKALLRAEGISPVDFNLTGGLRMEGERRPLRVPVTCVDVKSDPDGLLLLFFLPKGAYATSVLREIMKTW